MVKARKEAEGVVKEAKTREQEMQALRLEVEELEKAVQTQQQQVGRKEWGVQLASFWGLLFPQEFQCI